MDGCESEREREDERKLVRAVLEGRPEAAEALFERVFERLYRRVCARLGGDHAAAEDVASESLIAGLRALASFRGEASLETWLFRIALGKIADAKRRRALRIVAAGDGELERVLAARESHELSPSDRLERDELRAEVTAALEALPGRHRTVLWWRYVEESSLARLAARLSVTPKAAERRLARAREALAAALRRRHVEA